MKKVSVIVPVYNVEKYLCQCADSLVNQTLEDIEIILVSDASPDGSNAIMKEYEEQYPSKVKCIYLKENIKQGGARNRGLEIATGEYVTFVDSDDFVDVTLCEKMYEEATQNNYDIVYCDYYDNFLNEDRLCYMSFVGKEMVGELTEEKRKALFFTFVTPYGKLIKTKLIRDNKLYFPEKMFYEDAATTLLYHMYAKSIGWVNEPLYYYSIREDSTMRKKNSEHQFDEAKAGLILYNRFKERGFYQQYKDEIDMVFLIYFYMHPLRTAVEKFLELPLDYMEYLRDTMKKMYPNYHENKYFYLVEEAHVYDYIRMNDESPKGLKKAIETNEYDKKSASYEMCYSKARKNILHLFEQYKQENYRIAIWGAGPRGRAFLGVCDPERKYVDLVFDNNEMLDGTLTNTGHKICKYIDNYDKIDVILGMNRYHYQSIKMAMGEKQPHVKFINLDLWLQFQYNLDF